MEYDRHYGISLPCYYEKKSFDWMCSFLKNTLEMNIVPRNLCDHFLQTECIYMELSPVILISIVFPVKKLQTEFFFFFET